MCLNLAFVVKHGKIDYMFMSVAQKQLHMTSMLLVVSFMEGGALMAFEILSSKICTPYLGSSIYVWTSILTVTLSGLAVGYRIGGKYADTVPAGKLKQALLLAALMVGLSPFISVPVLQSMLSMDVKVASLMGGVAIVFLPVLAMGMVSPLIVGLISNAGSPAGSGISVPMAAGLVYGTGTLGGILFLLTTTFLLIPAIGVKASTFVLSGMLLLGALMAFKLKDQPNAQ